MLRERIDDGAFLRLICKWLKAGILEEDSKVVHPATGTPQGGIVSPVLANVYLHYVLDLWFEHRVKKQSQGAKHVLSVCNGAFILAKAGLLDNLSATTFYGLIDDLRAAAPKTRVVSDRRYVDNGAIITAAGLSSGIDGALHVLSRMLGQGRAQAVALHMEYDWRPDSGYARAALADRLLREIDLRDLGQTTILRTEGTRDRWEVAIGLRTDLKTADLREKVEGALEQGHGVKAGADQAPAGPTSAWRRTEDDGAAWKGRLTIKPDPAQDGQFTLTMNITR